MLFTAHTLFLSLAPCDQCYEGLVPLILMGIAYSIYAAALWPMIPIVIREESLGTAFGITLAIQNAGLAFGPNIVGLLKNLTDGYSVVSVFFMSVSAIGILSGIVLYFVNIRDHNNVLQKSTKAIANGE